jgi:hypothetical protein
MVGAFLQIGGEFVPSFMETVEEFLFLVVMLGGFETRPYGNA